MSVILSRASCKDDMNRVEAMRGATPPPVFCSRASSRGAKGRLQVSLPVSTSLTSLVPSPIPAPAHFNDPVSDLTILQLYSHTAQRLLRHGGS